MPIFRGYASFWECRWWLHSVIQCVDEDKDTELVASVNLISKAETISPRFADHRNPIWFFVTVKCLCWDTYLLLEDCLEASSFQSKKSCLIQLGVFSIYCTVRWLLQMGFVPTGSWDVASLVIRLIGVGFLNPFLLSCSTRYKNILQHHAVAQGEWEDPLWSRWGVPPLHFSSLSCLNMHFILFKSVIKSFKKECCSNHVSSWRMIFRYHIDMLSSSFS